MGLRGFCGWGQPLIPKDSPEKVWDLRVVGFIYSRFGFSGIWGFALWNVGCKIASATMLAQNRILITGEKLATWPHAVARGLHPKVNLKRKASSRILFCIFGPQSGRGLH